MADVVSLYEESLTRRGFVADPAQRRAVERLQQLYEEWSAYKARRNSALKRLLVKPPLPKGVDPNAEIPDREGRPMRVLEDQEPVRELLST